MLNRPDSKGNTAFGKYPASGANQIFCTFYVTDIMFLMERVSASVLLDSNLIYVCSLKRSVCFANIAARRKRFKYNLLKLLNNVEKGSGACSFGLYQSSYRVQQEKQR